MLDTDYLKWDTKRGLVNDRTGEQVLQFVTTYCSKTRRNQLGKLLVESWNTMARAKKIEIINEQNGYNHGKRNI